MSHEAINDLVTDEALQVRYIAGQAEELVVAFTGVGHGIGEIQTEEFTGVSLGEARRHVVFVIDTQRSWYSAPGIQGRIIEAIDSVVAKVRPSRIFTLGNSMGGFGALLLAERIGAEAAVAFAPQFTMRRDVIRERRWARYRPAMNESALDTLDGPLTGKSRAYAIFGANERLDRPHAKALDATGWVDVRRVVSPKGVKGHSVAGFLKSAGILQPLVAAMFDGDRVRIDALLEPFRVRRNFRTMLQGMWA